MKEIPLSRGKIAIVDDADFQWLNQWKWSFSPGKQDNGYAVRTGRKREGQRYRKAILMHREIMEAPSTLQVDHIDGNGLNNRRENLRLCTANQNRMHITRRRLGSPLYKGARQDKNGYWHAYIGGENRTQEYLGYYATAEEAAIAYNRRARVRWGKWAVLNDVPDRKITRLSFARRNTSGFYGVSYDKRRKRWIAQLRRGKKHIHLGRFATAEEAGKAVQEFLAQEEKGD